jgi:RNA polymerase sigma-70 factor (ECF subfamily)
MQRMLVERAQRGDREAFTDLASASLARLDAIARLILRDPDLAKDAVQNGLVRAWRDLPTLRDPDRFDAWIRRLVVRACLDEVRGQRRRPITTTVTDIGHPVVADTSSAVADQDQLERAFRRLRPEDRAILVLRHYLDLTVPDIADALRIPLGTAKSRLHRATEELRASLEADARPAPAYAEEPTS